MASKVCTLILLLRESKVYGLRRHTLKQPCNQTSKCFAYVVVKAKKLSQ